MTKMGILSLFYNAGGITLPDRTLCFLLLLLLLLSSSLRFNNGGFCHRSSHSCSLRLTPHSFFFHFFSLCFFSLFSSLHYIFNPISVSPSSIIFIRRMYFSFRRRSTFSGLYVAKASS